MLRANLLRANLVWAGLYAVLIVAILLGLQQLRRQALRVYGTPGAQQAWENWREDVRQLPPDRTPTRRAVPASGEPPALVLMRDYFWTCVLLVLALTTVLFVTMMVMVRGMLAPVAASGQKE